MGTNTGYDISYGISMNYNFNESTTNVHNIDKLGQQTDSKKLDGIKSSDDKKLVEDIRKQINNVNKNDNLNSKDKKEKVKDLKIELHDAQETEIQRKIKEHKESLEMISENKSQLNQEENSKNYESSDGDKLVISDEASKLIKDKAELKQSKLNEPVEVEFENNKEILKSQINTDKKRGVDTSKKEEQLEKLERRDARRDELKEMAKSGKSEKSTDNKQQNNVIDDIDYANAEEITNKFINN